VLKGDKGVSTWCSPRAAKKTLPAADRVYCNSIWSSVRSGGGRNLDGDQIRAGCKSRRDDGDRHRGVGHRGRGAAFDGPIGGPIKLLSNDTQSKTEES